MPPIASVSDTSSERLSATARAGKYLIFRLGNEEFGARVVKVKEIMGIQEVTPVPQMPPYIKGVINLRGKVIPVVDLRLRFAVETEEFTVRTCIVVMRTNLGTDELLTGVIVDEVVEVLNLSPAEIEDTPDFGAGVSTPYLLGMAKVEDKVKILLDIDEVLNNHEFQCLQTLIS